MSAEENGKDFKKTISFTQSVSSGIIGFHGTLGFDEDLDTSILVDMLHNQEAAFKAKGYKIATDIKPKEEKEKKEK